jgi:hypothetical protein
MNSIRQKLEQKTLQVGFTGLENRGKTFLINTLCGINLPSGHQVHTEGISIKFPSNGSNTTYIDTAGLGKINLK